MAKIENPLLWNLHSFHGKDLFTGRKSRGVYELEGIVDSTKVVEPQKCLNNLSSLSLLNTQQTFVAPAPCKIPVYFDDKSGETNIGEDGNLPSDGAERPMTPIDETIQMAPKTFSMLCKLIRKRINPRLHWTHLSTEDQLSLGAVILGEVNAIWSVFRQQVDDPFLSRQQNKELQRRITVHVVTVCEQLFLYYCDQVKVLNSRGVFSEAANLSRIRGQLALDAGKYLNILAVRRHIVSDLRGNTDLNIKKKVAVTPVAPQSPRYLSFQRLIERSRPKQPPQHDLNIMQEIADMRRQMPVLDVGKVCSLLPSKPSSIEIIESYDVISHDQVYNDVTPSPKPLLSTRLVGNWSSEPLLHTVGILEDLKNGEDNETLFPPSRLQQTPKPGASTKQVAHHVRNASSAPHVKLQEPSEISKVTHSEKTLDPKQDLINLLNSQKKIESSLDSHEDIPPLIQAITRREAQEKKMKELKKCEKELRERKRRFDEEERRKLPDPKHPQPLMVQVEVPGHANPIDHNNTTIRALDMGIPDKVDLPSVSLQTHGPLYNDLTGEISPAAVKELDANLFQGEELKEVYHEIMQTMPNQHLLLHNDSLVITPVENIDINEVLASTTLMRPHSQQIINPDLKKKGALPPWVGESHSVWERKDQLQLTTGTPGSGKNFSSSSPMGDKTTRAYASWLACWKATINTDDYFKYLSTQETDFLGVIYHFYDSEAALSESDAVSKTMELEVERKRSEVFEEIKEKKSSYTEGFWNVQTVSMGGLGKYPDLEEYDVTSNVEGAIDEVSTSSRQLPTNLQSLPSTSDESDDSGSNFRKIPPRRKSASARRKLKAQLRDENSSEEESRSDADYVENKDERFVDNRSRRSSLKSTERFREEHHVDVGRSPYEIIQAKLRRNKLYESLICDSGVSSTDVDTDGVVGGQSESRKRRDENDHGSSSGCVVSEDSLREIRSRNRSRNKFNKSSKSEILRLPDIEASKGSQAPVPDDPINLLKGYYKTSSRDVSSTAKSQRTTTVTSATKPKRSRTLQSRFETVWKNLKMTSSQKLDIALKYSSDDFLSLLDESIPCWEKVTGLIVNREKVLFDLQTFERDASDPQRFFHKGHMGSSATRLHEAKCRARLYQKLENLEKQITPLLGSMYSLYDDVVTYEGRPYKEKMSADKVEMLYWLQEERRCKRLDEYGYPEQWKQFMRDNRVSVTTQHDPALTNQIPMPVKTVTINQLV